MFENHYKTKWDTCKVYFFAFISAGSIVSQRQYFAEVDVTLFILMFNMFII